MRIAYTRPDGGVSIVNAAPKEQLARVLRFPVVDDEGKIIGDRGPTDAEYRAHVIERAVPKDATDVVEMAVDAVLPERAFRDAWVLKGRSIDHDMAKARAIHRAKIREARAPLLAQLDVEYQRADERSDTAGKAGIAARKQKLRDATSDPAIDAATTVDDLKAAWPAELGVDR